MYSISFRYIFAASNGSSLRIFTKSSRSASNPLLANLAIASFACSVLLFIAPTGLPVDSLFPF
jgi:hypothetical protein